MSSKERREKRKKQGLCIDCPRPATPGHVRCSSCLKRHVQKQGLLEKKRREQGLCIDCGRPTFPGNIRCLRHLVLNKNRARRYRNRNLLLMREKDTKRKQERRLQYRCVTCGAPLPVDDSCRSCCNCRTNLSRQGVYHEAFEQNHSTKF